MSTSYTSLLGLALPVQGELAGTWGDTVNNYITSYLDAAVAGTQSITTDADVTLTKTTNASLGATSSQYAILNCTGSRTALRTITAPAASKIYMVINATTGGYAVKLVGAGPTTGLTIPNGASAVVAWNGSDFVEVGSGTIGNLTVNGNLSVTGTTTLTGAATLTANPTFSGGTANGVLYLNGSKVATSGSALTFDGSTLKGGNFLGVNTTTFATNSRLAIQTSSGKFDVAAYGGSSVQVMSDAALAYYVPSSSYDHIWLQGAGELMRLTSTGLGIGTSSPGYKLDVSVGTNTIAQQWQGAGTNFTLRLKTGNGATSSSSVYRLYMDYLNGSYTNGYVDFYRGASGSDGYLVFGTAGSDRMTLDSSGNLGLGVTPSAWGSPFLAFQVGSNGAAISGRTDAQQLNLSSNWYYGGGTSKYIANGYATRYIQEEGGHYFSTAPSGTAGNTCTFTQALTLDANGKLLVGLTSSRSTNAIVQANAPINLQGYTVATLPAGTVGDTAYVTDATAPTFLGTLTGGGTVKCPVFHNGTAWVAY